MQEKLQNNKIEEIPQILDITRITQLIEAEMDKLVLPSSTEANTEQQQKSKQYLEEQKNILKERIQKILANFKSTVESFPHQQTEPQGSTQEQKSQTLVHTAAICNT